MEVKVVKITDAHLVGDVLITEEEEAGTETID